jgi:hypothetical protein
MRARSCQRRLRAHARRYGLASALRLLADFVETGRWG